VSEAGRSEEGQWALISNSPMISGAGHAGEIIGVPKEFCSNKIGDFDSIRYEIGTSK